MDSPDINPHILSGQLLSTDPMKTQQKVSLYSSDAGRTGCPKVEGSWTLVSHHLQESVPKRLQLQMLEPKTESTEKTNRAIGVDKDVFFITQNSQTAKAKIHGGVLHRHTSLPRGQWQ